jgi:hypothetical protein
MNTCTQPPGAGGSRLKAEGELTLGLMSGERRGCTPIAFCRRWRANEHNLQADQFLTDAHRSNCRRWLASEDDLTADQSLAGEMVL